MQMASTCEQGKDSHAVYFDKGQSFFQRSNRSVEMRLGDWEIRRLRDYQR
jgi:hypothetical protein